MLDGEVLREQKGDLLPAENLWCERKGQRASE